ncbi:hypothetical protein NV379_02365 [Paenibacillus sp. N1-5-1-14]|uniref:hypothetical protein n=1 Tax=Paenibacillus radicibacter TaxID=2972488 RepID=UPI002158AB65|nr:hypothetical protein [Paenibacillus radicibacter]MCR8641491.1 hypothetical protein [Paenibacillus radicibacter]
MQTPTIFQLGKLSSVIEEINKGIGSTLTFISQSERCGLEISLTFPNLVNDIGEINAVLEKIYNYFGLKNTDFSTSIESGYGKTRVILKSTIQELVITASNR